MNISQRPLARQALSSFQKNRAGTSEASLTRHLAWQKKRAQRARFFRKLPKLSSLLAYARRSEFRTSPRLLHWRELKAS